jgi:phage N-6-adenine-methyltransferase
VKVHFSSDKMDWETPQDLFDELDAEFGFVVDVCANEANAKCDAYYSEQGNALLMPDWAEYTGSSDDPSLFVFWMNPPYGREIGKWMKKAYEESQKGATVVCLVPSRTDTAWWHDYAMKADEIRYIRGRLKFVGAKNSAPFPSAIVIFRG